VRLPHARQAFFPGNSGIINYVGPGAQPWRWESLPSLHGRKDTTLKQRVETGWVPCRGECRRIIGGRPQRELRKNPDAGDRNRALGSSDRGEGRQPSRYEPQAMACFA
jgi:hypothetical protein